MTLNPIQIKNDAFRRDLVKNANSMKVFFAPNFVAYYDTNMPFFMKVLHTLIHLDENHFNKDNDPHEEHDMAFFEVDGERFFFKIDYYDESYQHFCGEENLLDDSKCNRVITVGHSSDY